VEQGLKNFCEISLQRTGNARCKLTTGARGKKRSPRGKTLLEVGKGTLIFGIDTAKGKGNLQPQRRKDTD